MNTVTVYIERPEGEVSAALDPRNFVIDPTNLDYDLCNIGATMVGYGQIEAELRAEVERKEASLDKLEADLDSGIRKEYASTKEKATEARIKNEIISNPSYQGMVESLRKSRLNHNIMRWAMNALNKKADCLIAMSYRERQLMKVGEY